MHHSFGPLLIHVNGNFTLFAVEFKHMLSYLNETLKKAMNVYWPRISTTKQALYGPLSITMANLLCPLSNSNSHCPVFMQLRDIVYGVIV